jgi:hypothetical protein
MFYRMIYNTFRFKVEFHLVNIIIYYIIDLDSAYARN